MKVINLCRDSQFIQFYHEIVCRLDPKSSGNHEYIITKLGVKGIKHLKTPYKVISNSHKIKKYIKEQEPELIICHNLSDINVIRAINSIAKSIKVAQFFWGTEFYSLKICSKILYSPFNPTNKTNDNKSFKQFLEGKWQDHKEKLRIKSFQRVDFFLHFNQEDHDFIKTYIPNINSQWLEMNYGTINQLIANDEDSKVIGDDILLGNSGDAANNHIESLHSLKGKLRNNQRIYCPLSYPDYNSNQYAQQVNALGKKLFRDKFIALKELLPLSEYMTIMKDCSTLFMNHYRPQAAGNIISGLYYGADIYLSNRSSLLAFYRKIGCVLHENNKYPIIDKAVNKNKDAVLKYFSEELTIIRYTNAFEIMLNMKVKA